MIKEFIRVDGEAVEIGGSSPELLPIVGEMWWPSPPYVINNGTGGSAPAIDADGEYVGWVFQVPRDGVITNLGFRGGGLSTNPSDVDVRLETVGSDGAPSGTLVSAGANASQSINIANAWWSPALTTPPTVAQGDYVALVVRWVSGSLSIQREPNVGIQYINGGIYGIQSIGGVVVRFVDGPLPFGVQYQDTGLYEPIVGSNPAFGTITNNYINTTDPDERGLLMSLPFDCRISGVWFTRGTTFGARTIKLYDISDNVLWSQVWDFNFSGGTGPRQILRLVDDLDLVAGDYRLTCLATDAGNIQVNELTTPSVEAINAIPGGFQTQWTERNDGGAWTDSPGKKVAMGLLLSGIMI